MTKDEVKKLRMNSPESLQFLNNATKFYNLMMMYRCAIREIQTKLEFFYFIFYHGTFLSTSSLISKHYLF